jgi:hypothetical protein
MQNAKPEGMVQPSPKRPCNNFSPIRERPVSSGISLSEQDRPILPTGPPRQQQQNTDAEHLKLLSAFHYLVSGRAAFFECFPMIHLGQVNRRKLRWPSASPASRAFGPDCHPRPGACEQTSGQPGFAAGAAPWGRLNLRVPPIQAPAPGPTPVVVLP